MSARVEVNIDDTYPDHTQLLAAIRVVNFSGLAVVGVWVRGRARVIPIQCVIFFLTVWRAV